MTELFYLIVNLSSFTPPASHNLSPISSMTFAEEDDEDDEDDKYKGRQRQGAAWTDVNQDTTGHSVSERAAVAR